VIAASFSQTAVERELVLRLASLLWRLRRIISIETDLLRIQSDISRERRSEFCVSSADPYDGSGSGTGSPSLILEGAEALPHSARNLTCCFLRLSNVDNGAFDRLGRYNAALWKQTAQTLFLLHSVPKDTSLPHRCACGGTLWDHVDLPPIKPITTRINLFRATCPCRKARVTAQAPTDMPEGSPFAPGISAAVAYLHGCQMVGFRRLTELCEGLFGLTIFQGAISNMLARMGKPFGAAAEQIAATVRGGEVSMPSMAASLFSNHRSPQKNCGNHGARPMNRTKPVPFFAKVARNIGPRERPGQIRTSNTTPTTRSPEEPESARTS
jgi:hypothetical protein